jgi:hypothetical protein
MTLIYLQLQLHKFLKLVMTYFTNSKKNVELEQSQIAPNNLTWGGSGSTLTNQAISLKNQMNRFLFRSLEGKKTSYLSHHSLFINL